MQIIDYERHTPAMDMFSLGVLLFVMLTGRKPMTSEQARTLTYSKMNAHEYPKMASWAWKRLSTDAQKLVLRLLELRPEKRITASQARSGSNATHPAAALNGPTPALEAASAER